jgi:glycosyltransferase involved in cell wall biosynthesis
LPEASRVIIVDDQSNDPRLLAILDQLAMQDARVELWRNPRRMGPNLGHAYNVPRVIGRFPTAEFLVFCDDDIVYHPNWLQRTIQVALEARIAGLNGVFAALNVPARPAYQSVTLPTSEVLLKERQAALNWVMPRAVYNRVGPFTGSEVAYDTDYCNRMAALNIPVICLRPSWVQNIGYFGAYQSGAEYVAEDFVGKMGFYLSCVRQYYAGRAAFLDAASQMKQRLHSLIKASPSDRRTTR